MCLAIDSLLFIRCIKYFQRVINRSFMVFLGLDDFSLHVTTVLTKQ